MGSLGTDDVEMEKEYLQFYVDFVPCLQLELTQPDQGSLWVATTDSSIRNWVRNVCVVCVCVNALNDTTQT